MPDRIKKFVDSLNLKTRERLKRRLVQLREDPFKHTNDVKKLKGAGKNLYRLRMGKIRIIYRLMDKEIEIVDIDYRGSIY